MPEEAVRARLGRHPRPGGRSAGCPSAYSSRSA